MDILNRRAESGAPWGTPAAMVNSGPITSLILMEILLLLKKFAMVLTKRGGKWS